MPKTIADFVFPLALAVGAAVLATSRLARSEPLPQPGYPDDVDPFPGDDEPEAPPPDSPGYAPIPGQPAPPAPPAPQLGPVTMNANGTWPLQRGATYLGRITVQLPAFLVTKEAVRARLTAAGFRVRSVRDLGNSRFEVVAQWNRADANKRAPELATIDSLERTG